MTSWRNIFPGDAIVDSIAPIATTTVDIDLRNELAGLLLGSNGGAKIAQPFILRRMRREGSELVPCICTDETTKEPDRDYPCPSCGGRGYLWDEELIYGYKVVSASPGGSNAEVNSPALPMGRAYIPSVHFYFQHDAALTREDRIIEIELDSEGRAITPYNRVAVYEIALIRAMRGTNGRIEFWTVNGQRMGPETYGAIG